MDNTTQRVYDLIQKKSGSNELLQAVSGVMGFPYTLLVDAGVCFSHYIPILHDMRRIYDRTPVGSSASLVVINVLKQCKKEIFADILVDKLIGQIPLVGIAANIMCAKTLTWRLGVLFAMLSAKSDSFTQEDVLSAIARIRQEFPQRKMFQFQAPSIKVVDCLLRGVPVPADDFDVDSFFQTVTYK